MPKKNRSTLKKYFKEGALPTSDHFADLIDSSLNIVDEGFDKSSNYGLEISIKENQDKLISFFRYSDPTTPQWSVNFDQRNDRLHIAKLKKDEPDKQILSLTSEGNVGVNNTTPEYMLDVPGTIRNSGRIGVALENKKSIPADGKWHDITEQLTGCHAFEVMAGVGKKETGRYALMHAIAINAFNPCGWLFNIFNRKKRIKYNQSFYLSISNKLKLRWYGRGHEYKLQLRSNSNYGNDIHIKYYVTQLWFDEDMSECLVTREIEELK